MGDLVKVGHSVVGLDCSTHSIAFCHMVDGVPKKWGEVAISGATAFERIYDARVKVAALGLKADVVAFEKAIYVNNMQASISLAYVYGAILSELMHNNSRVYGIEPLKWQSHIGNKLWTKKDKEALVKAEPGKPKTWYMQEMRRRRKQVTIDWVRKEFNVKLDSDNVADSFGIAFYATDQYIA